MNRLAVTFGEMTFQNPVMCASGTFAYGETLSEYFPLSALGGFVTKGISLRPRTGNPPPRMTETPCGILNSIGLQNIGLDNFLRDKLPLISDYSGNTAVNIAGHNENEFLRIVERLEESDALPIYELNVSCPNVDEGGMAFGQDRRALASLVKAVRDVSRKHIMVKLSPNVTSIADMALVCEDCGADSVSLINTVLGMAIDYRTRKTKTHRLMAGLSGPAIRPIALRMVYEVSRAVNLPIVGIGGITSWQHVLEFLIAGATLVQVGTATLADPTAPYRIINDLRDYLEKQNETVGDYIGTLQSDQQ